MGRPLHRATAPLGRHHAADHLLNYAIARFRDPPTGGLCPGSGKTDAEHTSPCEVTSRREHHEPSRPSNYPFATQAPRRTSGVRGDSALIVCPHPDSLLIFMTPLFRCHDYDATIQTTSPPTIHFGVIHSDATRPRSWQRIGLAFRECVLQNSRHEADAR